MAHKVKRLLKGVSAARGISKERKAKSNVQSVAQRPSEEIEKKVEDNTKKSNGLLLKTMLDVYIRGSDARDDPPRAARLVENLWDLATNKEYKPELRLDATKFIFERIDGKAVEHKEIKTMRLEGIVYIPEAKAIDVDTK